MAVIHDCSLSLDRFHWDRVSGMLIAEASDFGLCGMGIGGCGRFGMILRILGLVFVLM